LSAAAGGGIERLTPVERTVRATFAVVPGWFWFGPTWAYLCGVAAAAPFVSGPASLVPRAVAGWFVAVPLLTSVWSDGDRSAGARALSGVAAVSLASLLGGATPWVVAAAAIGGFACRMRGGRRCALPGAALVGWLALGGPVRTPAAEAVDLAPAMLVADFVRRNGAAITVFLAFAVVHHGVTSALGRRGLERCWLEIAGGHLAAIAVLAVSAHAFAAGFVALVFVGQWPYHSTLRAGRAVWHARHAQWLAMAAMLAASLAV
jgi:hypothetical protein